MAKDDRTNQTEDEDGYMSMDEWIDSLGGETPDDVTEEDCKSIERVLKRLPAGPSWKGVPGPDFETVPDKYAFVLDDKGNMHVIHRKAFTTVYLLESTRQRRRKTRLYPARTIWSWSVRKLIEDEHIIKDRNEESDNQAEWSFSDLVED